MSLGGAFGNCQPQAVARRALAGGTVKRFAQLRQMLVGNAWAVVANAQADSIAYLNRLQVYPLPGRVEAQGVAQQVVQRPLDHVRPALQVQIVLHLDLNMLFGTVQVRIVFQSVQQLAQIDRLRPAEICVQTRQGQNLADQRFQSVTFTAQTRPELFTLGRFCAFSQCQSNAQSGQRRAQLV